MKFLNYDSFEYKLFHIYNSLKYFNTKEKYFHGYSRDNFLLVKIDIDRNIITIEDDEDLYEIVYRDFSESYHIFLNNKKIIYLKIEDDNTKKIEEFKNKYEDFYNFIIEYTEYFDFVAPDEYREELNAYSVKVISNEMRYIKNKIDGIFSRMKSYNMFKNIDKNTSIKIFENKLFEILLIVKSSDNEECEYEIKFKNKFDDKMVLLYTLSKNIYLYYIDYEIEFDSISNKLIYTNTINIGLIAIIEYLNRLTDKTIDSLIRSYWYNEYKLMNILNENIIKDIDKKELDDDFKYCLDVIAEDDNKYITIKKKNYMYENKVYTDILLTEKENNLEKGYKIKYNGLNETLEIIDKNDSEYTRSYIANIYINIISKLEKSELYLSLSMSNDDNIKKRYINNINKLKDTLDNVFSKFKLCDNIEIKDKFYSFDLLNSDNININASIFKTDKEKINLKLYIEIKGLIDNKMIIEYIKDQNISIYDSVYYDIVFNKLTGDVKEEDIEKLNIAIGIINDNVDKIYIKDTYIINILSIFDNITYIFKNKKLTLLRKNISGEISKDEYPILFKYNADINIVNEYNIILNADITTQNNDIVKLHYKDECVLRYDPLNNDFSGTLDDLNDVDLLYIMINLYGISYYIHSVIRERLGAINVKEYKDKIDKIYKKSINDIYKYKDIIFDFKYNLYKIRIGDKNSDVFTDSDIDLKNIEVLILINLVYNTLENNIPFKYDIEDNNTMFGKTIRYEDCRFIYNSDELDKYINTFYKGIGAYKAENKAINTRYIIDRLLDIEFMSKRYQDFTDFLKENMYNDIVDIIRYSKLMKNIDMTTNIKLYNYIKPLLCNIDLTNIDDTYKMINLIINMINSKSGVELYIKNTEDVNILINDIVKYLYMIYYDMIKMINHYEIISILND